MMLTRMLNSQVSARILRGVNSIVSRPAAPLAVGAQVPAGLAQPALPRALLDPSGLSAASAALPSVRVFASALSPGLAKMPSCVGLGADLGIGRFVDELLGRSLVFIKRTYQPSTLRRKRKFGFLRKVKSKAGRKILMRRFRKGRKHLAPVK